MLPFLGSVRFIRVFGDPNLTLNRHWPTDPVSRLDFNLKTRRNSGDPHPPPYVNSKRSSITAKVYLNPTPNIEVSADTPLLYTTWKHKTTLRVWQPVDSRLISFSSSLYFTGNTRTTKNSLGDRIPLICREIWKNDVEKRDGCRSWCGFGCGWFGWPRWCVVGVVRDTLLHGLII